MKSYKKKDAMLLISYGFNHSCYYVFIRHKHDVSQKHNKVLLKDCAYHSRLSTKKLLNEEEFLEKKDTKI